MPNFDPAQELPLDSTVQTVPVSLPNQFGAVVAGTPSNPNVAPLGNPADQVINPNAIVDPAMRAQYIASQVPAVQPVAPLPAAAAVPAVPVPVQSVDPTTGFAGTATGAHRVPDTNIDPAINAASAEQQKALTAEGKAQSDAATAEADARSQGAEQLAAQQQQLKAQQVQRDAALRQLNQDSSDALEKAHKTTVPDFWEGKPGQAVTAAILVGLGAVGQGLTAFGTGNNLGNGAQGIINHAVDSYAEKKRDEINNLYKYAAAKNQLSQEQKLEWATKLNEVQFDLAATHQSIQDHLNEVAAQGRGKIDQAHYATLAADNQQHTQQLLEAAQMNRAQINHMRNEDANAAARIGIERTKASGEKADHEEDKQLQLAQSTFGKKAEIARNRLDGNADIVRSLKDPNISGGELRQKLEQVMALNQGEGKRGVTTASLHLVAPKLVGVDGKLADDFDTLIHGSSGTKMREAVLKLGQTGLDDAQREYAQQQKDFKGGSVANYYKAHPEKVQEHLQRFYPERDIPKALPAGAIPGQLNGKRGYVLNGAFVAQ